jgi:hypothetical protein
MGSGECVRAEGRRRSMLRHGHERLAYQVFQFPVNAATSLGSEAPQDSIRLPNLNRKLAVHRYETICGQVFPRRSYPKGNDRLS